MTNVRCTELELEPEPRPGDNPGHVVSHSTLALDSLTAAEWIGVTTRLTLCRVPQDIDGEEVPFGPVRVSVKQGMGRVMCRPLAAKARAV